MSCCKVIEPGDTVRITDFRDDEYGRTGKVLSVENAQVACEAKGLPYYGDPATVVITFRIPRFRRLHSLASQYVEKVCEHGEAGR